MALLEHRLPISSERKFSEEELREVAYVGKPRLSFWMGLLA